MSNFLVRNRKNIFVTLFVFLLTFFVTGVTYAFFEAFAEKENTVTGGTCFSVRYTKGQNIDSELSMGTSYTSGKSTNIVISIDNQTASNRCSNIIGKGTIFLNTVSSNIDFTNTGNIPLMYSVVVGNTVLASGEVTGVSKQALYTNFNVTTTSVTYKVYLWYNENKDNDNDFTDINYSGYISAEVMAESTIKS